MRRRPAPRWALWGAGTVLAAFAIGYLFTALVFFPSTDRPPIVAVPDLRELSSSEAAGAARAVGLELELSDSFPNPRVPAGQVLSQTPLPGQEVAPGTAVQVILSSGSERRTVPVVASMTREQAIAVLDAMGFETRIQEVEDPRAAGRVVGIDPAAGTELRVPSAVTLRVSSGPPMVVVPDLAGLTQEESKRALEEVGLVIGEVEHRFAGFYAPEEVTWQDPVPGASVPEGTAVRVQIASDRLPGRRVR